MFVNRLSSYTTVPRCSWVVLGVDNARHIVGPRAGAPGADCTEPIPLQGMRPGFDLVIRTGSGVYEYVVQGQPHPDSLNAASRSEPLVQTAIPAPLSPVDYSFGTIEATIPVQSPPEKQVDSSGGFGLLALVGILAMGLGG